MATNDYECLFILDSNRYARDPQGVPATIPEMIAKSSGEILASRLWNEQKLAYPINGHRKGTYWLTYFRMESGELSKFNRACQLNDNVLRHMVTKVDPRLVDILVAHALGRGSEEPADEEKAAGSTESTGPAAATPEGGTSDSKAEKVAAATDE